MKPIIYMLGLSALLAITSAQRLVPLGSQSLGQYNAPCLTSSNCDKAKGLYCVPPTNPSSGNQPRCRCPTNSTIFDEVRSLCVARIGENCAYRGNTSYCPVNSHCSHTDPRSDLYFYESKCFCDPNFIPNEKGTCSPAARYGNLCNHSDKICDKLAGLKCDLETKTCVCEFDEQYYDKASEKCLSFIGKKCTNYYGCAENARCVGLAPARSRSFVSANDARKPASSDKAIIQQNNTPRQVSTIDGRLIGMCVCEFGFSAASNGRCMATYRSSCSANQPCNPLDNLDCQDGRCNCHSPLHQYYDYNRKKCVGLVGSKCTGTNSLECVDNAECLNGLCTCKPQYSETPHRKCLLDFSQQCENDTCNVYNGLTCKSQQCVCMDDTLVYNRTLHRCLSRLHMPCGKVGHTGDYGNGKDSYYVACEPPAVCKQEVDGDLTTSFCRLNGRNAL